MTAENPLQKFLGDRVVLVIEPSATYRTAMKNFFYKLRIKTVRYVTSASEARQEMLAIKVGLIICEWQLPEKNGLIFCRELRREKKYMNTPFLLLSGDTFRSYVILASEVGIDGYLMKPFSFEEFRGQIASLLQNQYNPNPFNSLLERAEVHINGNETWVAETLLNEALSLRPIG